MFKFIIDMYAVPVGYYLVEAVSYIFIIIYEGFGMNYKHFEEVGTKPAFFAKGKNTFNT